MWRAGCIGVVCFLLVGGCGEVLETSDGAPSDGTAANQDGALLDASSASDGAPDAPVSSDAATDGAVVPDAALDSAGVPDAMADARDGMVDGPPPPCGGKDQDCCIDNTCNANLVCSGGKCRCGGNGQPCCPSSVCTFGCCGGGGVSNVCGAEPDATLCSRNSKQCGTFNAQDNCGNFRTANCGGCTTGCCGGSGIPNSCGTEPNGQFCFHHNANCGTVTGLDNCGNLRSNVDCGFCSCPEICTNHQCAAPTSCSSDTNFACECKSQCCNNVCLNGTCGL